MKTQNFVITSYDRPFNPDGLTIYKAGAKERYLNADDYGFRNANVLVFDKNGNLYEGGCNLSSGEYSVQKNVILPNRRNLQAKTVCPHLSKAGFIPDMTKKICI